MSKSPIIQGWCPGALRPMQSGDGLVVRVRPHRGRLTPEQAKGIAKLAQAHGSGLIDLSARANVQLRGVTEASHGPLVLGLAALGLIDENAEAEARRNIIVTPFWQNSDPAPTLAQCLAEALASPDAPVLPGKFGFAIDTGMRPVLRGVSADIRLESLHDGLILRADGASAGKRITLENAAQEVLALANWFVSSGGVKERRGRMAAHLTKGARLPEGFNIPTPEVEAMQSRPGPTPQGYLTGFAFGQMQAETLAQLAGLGALRVTPWRMLLIEGLHDAPNFGDLITRADDPMLRVVACTGAPGCPQALAPTRQLGLTLAPLVPTGTLLHISGCAKGCAHPRAANYTLVATPDGYRPMRDAAASYATNHTSHTADALIAEPGLIFENSHAP